ncbi:MAG: disulfide bond formation protein B [Zoogloeaceae bacterium]|nr:disulfide bond formation protein B [Zoogloeaceae bacterium]
MVLHVLRALTPRQWFLSLGLAAWGLDITGLLIQYWEHLNPCPLCIFQRLLFMVFGTFALLFALPPARFLHRLYRGMGVFLALICVSGLGVASYQTLMQSVPGLVSECSYSHPGVIERFVDWLGGTWLEFDLPVLSDLFLATGTCSDKEWVFLGLSLANWAAVAFLTFGVAAVWAIRRRVRG